jgi:hypothetical protein
MKSGDSTDSLLAATCFYDAMKKRLAHNSDPFANSHCFPRLEVIFHPKATMEVKNEALMRDGVNLNFWSEPLLHLN